mmetsp:Transcript_158740/g.280411  ORF Transcript_158740/g.280411 Transcript_158740/m.280411 type:complete len:286 (-) Transcript_158740:120-977(-)
MLVTMHAFASILFSLAFASRGHLAPSLAKVAQGEAQDSSRELARLLVDVAVSDAHAVHALNHLETADDSAPASPSLAELTQMKSSRQAEAQEPSRELASLLLNVAASAGWAVVDTRSGRNSGGFGPIVSHRPRVAMDIDDPVVDEIVGGGKRGDFAEFERVQALGERPVKRKLEELQDEVEHSEVIEQAIGENKKVVIKFLARWCRSCRSMKPKFEVLAKQFPEVEFYEIDFDKNKELAKSLGIPKLPYVEVIDGEKGLTDSFICGRGNLTYLKDTLASLGEVDI